MKFKYYGEYVNSQEAITFYQDLFQAKIVKQDDHHCNIKLFNKIPLLMHQANILREKPGYYIIRFEDNEVELYKEAIAKINERKIRTSFNNYEARWGTTFTEFKDPFGYTWVLEVSTEALKD